MSAVQCDLSALCACVCNDVCTNQQQLEQEIIRVHDAGRAPRGLGWGEVGWKGGLLAAGGATCGVCVCMRLCVSRVVVAVCVRESANLMTVHCSAFIHTPRPTRSLSRILPPVLQAPIEEPPPNTSTSKAAYFSWEPAHVDGEHLVPRVSGHCTSCLHARVLRLKPS